MTKIINIVKSAPGAGGPEPTEEMSMWVKKVGKIYRSLLILEKSKVTQPIISPTFSGLIECL